jgi:peptidyl-prolyl cis-trans isomerase D
MSVIQQIQEKYAKLMAVIIAIALLTFVVMLAFENGGSLFRGGSSDTVGKVNGKSIKVADFQKNIAEQEANMRQQGYPAGAATTQQAQENAWNQEIFRTLMMNEVDKLGMQVGRRETGDILYGANPPEDIKRAYTDPQTGVFNSQKAKQDIDQSLKSGSAEQKANISNYLVRLEEMRLSEKYNSLLSNSVNVPKWLIEKENADNSQMAKISLVREFYSTPSIPDSSIKISDKEIEEYINKHKKEFKQEETRSISYVTFSTLPTAADTLAIRQELESLKMVFDTTKDAPAFVAANGSAVNYSDIYVGKSFMQMQLKDSIQSLPVNAAMGPYLDGGTFTMAKMLDIKMLPDSVRCRHILLGTVNPQTGAPIMEDSVAHAKVDSVSAAIMGGANFDSLETKYTTDEASHRDKGVMTFSSMDIQGENFAKEFGQFILFDGKPGDKKVVKTSFGWHYIEILNFINVEPHYKIAYLAKQIEPSRETLDAALNEANTFAASSRDGKSFEANGEKLRAKGINKTFAQDITPNASQIMGLGASRQFVKSIYSAKLGEVLQPELVGDSYVVAVVTEVNEEGTKTAAKARLMVEPVLRNLKKGEMLKQKIGKITTLEAVGAALGGKTIETVDSLRMTGSQSSVVASEQKVIGASFNPANKGKVVPEVILGNSGVFVVRVDNVSTTALGDANVTDQRNARIQQAKMSSGYALQALRQAAEVKDNRSKFF